MIRLSNLIAHAGGEIDSKKYTNSLEAIINSINNFQLIELDILECSDGLIVAHDGLESRYGVNGCFADITKSDFKKTKYLSKYTTLTFDDLSHLLIKQDTKFVIDIKSKGLGFSKCIDYIVESCTKNNSFDRFIIQVYSKEDFDVVKNYAFSGAIIIFWKNYGNLFTNKSYGFADYCLANKNKFRNGIVGLSIRYRRPGDQTININSNKFKKYIDYNLPVYIHGQLFEDENNIIEKGYGLYTAKHLLNGSGDFEMINLMQFWDTAELPSEIKVLTNSWKSNNPNYNYILYNRDTAKEFMRQNFDTDIYNAFCALRIQAMMSDVFRVAYIYKVGGCYVDCAIKSNGPIHELIDGSRITLISKPQGNVWNGFFAAKVGDCFIATAWNIIKNNILNRTEGSIWSLTGPGVFQSTFEKKANEVNVNLIPQKNCYDYFELIQKLPHKGNHTHWDVRQKYEPLYNDRFKPIECTLNLHKKILIHMGDYNCGTESVVEYFEHNKSALTDYLLPSTGLRADGHSDLFKVLSSTNENQINEFFDRFYDEIINSEANVIFISCNMFSSNSALHFDKLSMTNFWYNLSQLIKPFEKKSMCYFLREQSESAELRLRDAILGKKCFKNINFFSNKQFFPLNYFHFDLALRYYFQEVDITPLNLTLTQQDDFEHFPFFFHKVLGVGSLPSNARNSLTVSSKVIDISLLINNLDIATYEKVDIKNKLLNIDVDSSKDIFHLDCEIIKKIIKLYDSSNQNFFSVYGDLVKF